MRDAKTEKKGCGCNGEIKSEGCKGGKREAAEAACPCGPACACTPTCTCPSGCGCG